ncbi:MAG: hypothetical protein IAE78_01785 [Myxococcus sp.]|nr:hypothetical protein [Myxococcus sp.]
MAVPEPVVAVPEPVVAVPEPVAPAPQPAAEVPAPGEPSAAFDGDELAPLDVRAPKEVRKVARPVPACTFDDAFKALARRDMQALSAEAARKGLPAAVLRSLDDEFGNAMVGRDCRGALRALDKVRRHASSR